MLAKITLYDGTIYRIADITQDTSDGLYLGKIKDELSLLSQMSEIGNAPTSINLTILNDDNFIASNKDLWAAEVLITNDSSITWKGKVDFFNFDADGNVYLTASEKTAPELELQLPDEVRQVYSVDEDFHQSSVTMTIPLVIGGTTSNPITLSTILIDKTAGVYLICVGEIRSIIKVYNGSEELPSTAYQAFTGTADQEENAGFAYVKIAEYYRLNSDGSYAEINVDVVGLKLGDFTEEECRNGALFLYYFLTTASSGVNGWGCGIEQSEIDTDSFQSAITLCNQLGYKLDGIMWLRQSAQSWIDQICQAIHGTYSINADGKRRLFIDYAGNSSKKTFTASNMRVERRGKNSYTSVVCNKGVFSYDYNPITGLFMQSAQYENADSIAQIGEQKFVGESYLVKDPSTALAILEYHCKRSQTAAEAIEFKTDNVDTVLRAGDVITINRPDLSINNALYQIQNISITDYEASISAVKFDTSVFIVSGTPSSVNWGSEKAITPALTPAQATNLLLSTGFDINPDGTGTPYISGTFTVPEGGWLAAAVQYGISASPSNWTELALITEGRFKISPVNVGTVYSIRVRMITSTGHSDYITGQITATGDTIPPSEPTIAVKATDKTVTVQCGLDNPPYDMGGFQIYRKKSTEQVYTYIGSIAANRGYASFSDYVDEYVTYNYQAKSYDRSGNLSTNFSNTASVTVTGIQANDVAATALAMPTGSILRISAKNSTTASIAESKGVKDVSGNNKHGKAIGGVEIVKDNVLGDCFFFNGTDSSEKGCLSFLDYPDFFSGLNGVTYSLKFKSTNISANDYRVLFLATGSAANSLFATCNIYPDGKIEIRLEVKPLATGGLFSSEAGVIQQDKNYNLIVSSDFVEGKMYVYLDGALIGQKDINRQSVVGNIALAFNFGSHYDSATYKNYRFIGFISDIRIYPRVITATEAKSIYMLPEEALMGQLTSDLIGTNIIKAKHLVMTEAVIASSAQIDTAAFREIVVGNTGVDINNLFYRFKKSVTNGGSITRNGISISHFEGGSSSWNSDNTGVTWVRGSGTNGHIRLAYLGLNGDNKRPYNIIFNAYASSNLTMIAEIGNSDSEPLSITTTNQEFNVTVKPTSFCTKNDSFNGFLDFITDVGNAGKTIYISNIRIYDGGVCGKYTTKIDENGIYTGSLTANQITAGTLDAARIAANAITAEKLNVEALKAPAGCVCYINAQGMAAGVYSSGTVADSSGHQRKANISGSVQIYDKNVSAPAFFTWENGQQGSLWTAQEVWGTQYLTFEVWLFPTNYTDTANHAIVSNYPNTLRTSGICLYQNKLKLRAFVKDQYGPNECNVSITAEALTQVVLLYNAQSGSLTWFVNGVQRNTVTDDILKQTMSTANANIIINAPIYNNYYAQNEIVSVRVYKRILSATEIKTLYMLGTDTESGQITADRIAAGCVETRHLTADAIVGKTFQTASNTGTSNAAGVRFNSSGIQGFNGSAKKFDLNTNGKLTCSDVDLTGKITATSGKIGGWNISGSAINLLSGSTSTAYLNLSTTTYTDPTQSVGYYVNVTPKDISCVQSYTQSGSTIKYHESYISSSSIAQISNQENYRHKIELVAGYSGASQNAALLTVYGADLTTSSYCIVATGKIVGQAGQICDKSVKSKIKNTFTLNKLKQIEIKQFSYNNAEMIKKQNEAIEAQNIEIDRINAEIEKENEGKEENEKIPLYRKKEKLEVVYKANNQKNIGVLAEEFNTMFGLNNNSHDDVMLLDLCGVALRSVQELSAQLDNAVRELRRIKRILKQNNILSDEIIAQDKENEEIRKAEILQKRQLKKEQKNSINTSETDDLKV